MKKGFTIIETLVAITIMVVVLTSFVSLTLLGQRGFQTAKLKYTAAKIAQEGIELIINKKQNNVLCVLASLGGGPCSAWGSWQNNLIGTWQVDAAQRQRLRANQTLAPYVPGQHLCINTAGPNEGIFAYSCAGPDTDLPGNFERKVEVESLGSANIRIKSTVYWTDRTTTKDLVIEEIVFGLP